MGKNNNGRTIKIQLGKVNQPVVETITGEDDLKTAVFGSQYHQMLAMLNRYVKYASKDSIYSPISPRIVFMKPKTTMNNEKHS